MQNEKNSKNNSKNKGTYSRSCFNLSILRSICWISNLWGSVVSWPSFLLPFFSMGFEFSLSSVFFFGSLESWFLSSFRDESIWGSWTAVGVVLGLFSGSLGISDPEFRGEAKAESGLIGGVVLDPNAIGEWWMKRDIFCGVIKRRVWWGLTRAFLKSFLSKTTSNQGELSLFKWKKKKEKKKDLIIRILMIYGWRDNKRKSMAVGDLNLWV